TDKNDEADQPRREEENGRADLAGTVTVLAPAISVREKHSCKRNRDHQTIQREIRGPPHDVRRRRSKDFIQLSLHLNLGALQRELHFILTCGLSLFGKFMTDGRFVGANVLIPKQLPDR